MVMAASMSWKANDDASADWRLQLGSFMKQVHNVFMCSTEASAAWMRHFCYISFMHLHALFLTKNKLHTAKSAAYAFPASDMLQRYPYKLCTRRDGSRFTASDTGMGGVLDYAVNFSFTSKTFHLLFVIASLPTCLSVALKA